MNDENITVISSCRDKNAPLWATGALCTAGYCGKVVIKTRLFEQLKLTESGLSQQAVTGVHLLATEATCTETRYG
ncbi:hypothetical protein ACUVFX_001712 [Escherichia coli]